MARPRFRATAENRNAVEQMAAIGTPEDKIAKVIGEHGIDPKTLRKYFSKELSRGAAKGEVTIRQKAYQVARDGHPGMLIHLLDKMDSKQTGGYGPRIGAEEARAKLAHLLALRHAARKREQTAGERLIAPVTG